MSRASQYADLCAQLQEAGSEFKFHGYAEVTHKGEIRILKQEHERVLPAEEALKLADWIYKMFDEDED